jgi:NarL family two-component system sensor histidine kinase YdfH
MDTSMHYFRPLRWLLIVWVGVVYIWELLISFFGLPMKETFSIVQCADPQQPDLLCHPLNPVAPFPVILIATLLTLLFGILLWISLANTTRPRFLWFYFPVQGVLVFAIGMLLKQSNIVLSLYLALTLGAISVLRNLRLSMLVACSALVLFLVNCLFDIEIWKWGYSWAAVLFPSNFDYLALILFVSGYLMLHLYQTRARVQLETAHTELAQTHLQLETAHQQLQASAQQIKELTLLTERQRLARELHDTLAQGVSGIVMQLEAANAQLAQQELLLVQAILHQAMQHARSTLQEARGAIDDLRVLTNQSSFSQSLQAEIARFQSTTGITCYENVQNFVAIPVHLYKPIFQMIREGLTNVARHAHAQHVWIRYHLTDRLLIVELQDDGQGFDCTAVNQRSGHYGLLGIQEQVGLIDGVFEVQSKPHKGTMLRLAMPRNTEVDGDE